MRPPASLAASVLAVAAVLAACGGGDGGSEPGDGGGAGGDGDATRTTAGVTGDPPAALPTGQPADPACAAGRLGERG